MNDDRTTVTYATFWTTVTYVPPSPMGLVGNRWVVEHRCIRCSQKVEGLLPADLIRHAETCPGAALSEGAEK